MFLYYSESLADIVIEESEVIDIKSVLPINKAIGPDCISHKMLKSTLHAVSCMVFCDPSRTFEFGTMVFFSNYKPTGLMEISYSGLKITYII